MYGLRLAAARQAVPFKSLSFSAASSVGLEMIEGIWAFTGCGKSRSFDSHLPPFFPVTNDGCPISARFWQMWDSENLALNCRLCISQAVLGKRAFRTDTAEAHWNPTSAKTGQIWGTHHLLQGKIKAYPALPCRATGRSVPPGLRRCSLERLMLLTSNLKPQTQAKRCR
jgi:hypothetical protein